MVIRSGVAIGNHVVVGTNTVIDGFAEIGNFVKIETNCYVPPQTKIGNRVFLGPGVVLTNDKYPLKKRATYKPNGPKIMDNVTIGAGAIILPGVNIEEFSFVAAGAVVTKNIPWSFFRDWQPGNN